MQEFDAGAVELEKLFAPKSIALIGASERPGSLGTLVHSNLLAAGFSGPIYPVNPRYTELGGRPCHADVGAIGNPVELAVIATPAATVPAVLEDCGKSGVRAAVILSAGFREVGAAGERLERAVIEAARRYGIRFMGPNCLGVMRPKHGLNATFSHVMARPGRIALVSQSGALCTAMLDWADEHAVGFSVVVSSGIAADVDFGELLDYLVLDPTTEAIMLYVEGIHDARRFMSALRAAARAKPVIVMKAGRHSIGGRAAISHTGALVGSDDVFAAALSRAGVVRVTEYTEFYAVAQTLHLGLRTRGRRIAIVTNGGGPGVMTADAATDRGLVMATLSEATRAALDALLPSSGSRTNPVDVLGDATPERFSGAIRACLDDPEVDAVIAILVPLAATDPNVVAAQVAAIGGDARTHKALLTCWMGEATMKASRALFRERGIPSYRTPEEAVVALAAAAQYRANQQLLVQVPAPLASRSEPDSEGAKLVIRAALAEGRSLLDVVESKAVLGAFGIPLLQSIPAHDAAEALAIAEEIGFPVAMKIHSRDIAHKSDVGGVRLGIEHGREVAPVFREIVDSARRSRPEARILGVLIEKLWRAPHARELMLGVVNDAVFGPVISLGLGGTLVEILRDRAIGLPPLNRYLASQLIESTRVARYLAEFRGWPAAARPALEETILRLSELVCELPWVAELDINPLVVDERGAMALDARLVVRNISAAAQAYSHMAIHPYPSQLVAEHRLPDGTNVEIRPIRPEDAESERAFVNGLSERSRYLRFMYALKEITPQMVSRFTQIDYDREMALIALVDSGAAQRQIGVARYVVYPDGRGCEFAVVVADDWQQRGIATELLRRLIEIARGRRLERMDGIVLAENRGMLVLAKELGFEQGTARDPGLVQMSLRL